MTTHRMELSKSRKDTLLDTASMVVFVGLIYFVMNPEAYDRVMNAAEQGLAKLTNHLSVWQTRLSIRSLPETEDR